MPDLTTTHLQHLLDQATPGPWSVIETYPDGAPRLDMSRQIRSANGEYLGIMHEPDVRLGAAAPALAQEVLRMRKELTNLQEEARLAAKLYATGKRYTLTEVQE